MPQTITFADKSNTLPSVNPVNEVRAEDINDLKNAINFNAGELGSTISQTSTNTTEISDINNKIDLKQNSDLVLFTDSEITIEYSEYLNVDASDGEKLITLKTAVGVAGVQNNVRKIDDSSNVVKIQTTGGQTINGKNIIILNYQYSSVTFVSDGANWMIK
jgi:hypothetical protein